MAGIVPKVVMTSVTFSFAVFFLMIVSSPSLWGQTLEERVISAQKDYQSCIDSLPAPSRRSFKTPHSQPVRLSKSVRERLLHCVELKQKYGALQNVSSLKSDLVSLHGSQNLLPAPGLEDEALEIAVSLIETTGLLNKEYRMGRSALWHNFLIKIGSKKGGYCYHWTENLLKALPAKPLRYFERHWGVHDRGRITENNAVIITRRKDPVDKGIVYDAWRGKGFPFWRSVVRDTQDWTELFKEDEILAGRM